MRKSFALIAFALLIASAALAAEKKPLTHETMWLMERVGAPQPSPDGKGVAFQLTEPAYDEKDQVSDIWIVPADGSAKPRRLTATKGGESGIAWSADSRRIAFSAKREGDEAAQIYLLDVTGGEAVRLTALATGARGPQFSPDGTALLFTSNVYPGAATEEANAKAAKEKKDAKVKARVYDGFPIRRWDRWVDETRPHVFVVGLEPGAKPRDLLAGSKLVAAPGFGGGAGEGSTEELRPVWAPDGKSIVFTASTNRNQGAYAFTSTHLFQVGLDGGEPRQLTRGDDSYGAPRFSPDGTRLAASYTPRGAKLYALDRVILFAWPAMNTSVVATQSFDRSVDDFAFAPDGRTIYLIAEDAGLRKIYSVPATGGEVRLAIAPERGVYTSMAIPEAASETMLFAQWGSSVNPAEVVRIDLGSKSHRNLTEFNVADAAAIDWQPPTHFWFKSKGGKQIHNMLFLPPGFDASKKYPLLVLMHGGPHGMWGDQISLRWNYHLLATPGYVVLATNFTGSTGFGEKFAQEIQGDPFKTPADEINQAADEAIARFKFIDGSRQCAAGASYGGHLANWMQATTTRYKCLVSHAGAINMESQWGTSDTIYGREVGAGGPPWEQGRVWREQNPIRFAGKFKTPMLVTVGENDFRVPLNQSLENWSVLQRMRVPSRLIVFPDENHWILKGDNSRFFYDELFRWFGEWMR